MPALNITTGVPHLFRSYLVRKHQTVDCKIWEAARATTAAPTFFKRIVISGPGDARVYADGSVGCNNPIMQVLEEAALVFPGQQVACVISIGTGQARTIAVPKPSWHQQVLPLDIVKAIQGIATDCERSAQEVAQRFQGLPNVYFRFNVEQGMQNVRLSGWERLDEVATHTNQYMRMMEVDQLLDFAATAIRQRRKTVLTAQISMEVAGLPCS
jgi:predicted acylesterase/phospholipase RssA